MSAASYLKLQSGFPLLVVSADQRDYSSLHRILQQDCQLHGAADRREALSTIRRCRPWVVVCDQTLADGDWRDLLTDLQSVQDMPPLIVFSSLADDRLWAEVLNLGGYDLLTKPFAATEVSRVVKLAAHRGSHLASR
jgi:DNA-binding response OmpR family regulator